MPPQGGWGRSGDELWNNGGWDEDRTRYHFVPWADTKAPTGNSAGLVLWFRRFSGPYPGGLNALFDDGAVKLIKSAVNASTFRKIAGANADEVLSFDVYGL